MQKAFCFRSQFEPFIERSGDSHSCSAVVGSMRTFMNLRLALAHQHVTVRVCSAMDTCQLLELQLASWSQETEVLLCNGGRSSYARCGSLSD